MRSPQVSHLLGCVWGKCAYSWVLAQTERAMKGWRREIGAEEDEDEEGCERGGVHIEGKTNYYPDNRQPMDFLPGLFCCSSSFCLFLFLPLCSRFKFQLRGALLTWLKTSFSVCVCVCVVWLTTGDGLLKCVRQQSLTFCQSAPCLCVSHCDLRPHDLICIVMVPFCIKGFGGLGRFIVMCSCYVRGWRLKKKKKETCQILSAKPKYL